MGEVTWTTKAAKATQRLRGAGVSFEEISAALGGIYPPERCEEEHLRFLAARRERRAQRKATRRSPVLTGLHVTPIAIPDAVLIARDERRQRADISIMLLGDPPPERSALAGYTGWRPYEAIAPASHF